MKNMQVASQRFMAVRLETTGRLDRNLTKQKVQPKDLLRMRDAAGVADDVVKMWDSMWWGKTKIKPPINLQAIAIPFKISFVPESKL